MKGIVSDPRLRLRMLFVVGNLAAGAAIVSIGVLPLFEMFAERETRIEQQSKQLGRLQAIVNQTARVDAVEAQTKAQMQGAEFLAGASENVVSADLQTNLKALTQAAGASLLTVQALPPKTVDHLRYSGARIEISGSLQSILKAVYAIEASTPYLFISAATLKSTQAQPGGVSEEPVVQAQLDVVGAMQAGKQP